MLERLLMYFRASHQQPELSAELPARVEAALAGAFVLTRTPDEDGMPRVIVQPPGMNGWLHGQDEAAIRARWPALNANQLRAAALMVRGVVQAHFNRTGQALRKRRTNWVNTW